MREKLKRFRLFINGNVELMAAVERKMAEFELVVSQDKFVYPRIGWLYININEDMKTAFDSARFEPNDEEHGPEMKVKDFLRAKRSDIFEEIPIKYPALARFNPKSNIDGGHGVFYVLFTDKTTGIVVKSEVENRPIGWSSTEWFEIGEKTPSGEVAFEEVPAGYPLVLVEED